MSDYCICKECGCKHLVWEKSCPYCRRIKELQAKYDALEALLIEVANIAHHGGLIGKDESDLLRLTLPYWDIAECEKLQRQENETSR